MQSWAAGSGATALAPIPPVALMAGAHTAGNADRRSQLGRADPLSRTHSAAATVMGEHRGAPQWPTVAPGPFGPLRGVRDEVVDSSADTRTRPRVRTPPRSHPFRARTRPGMLTGGAS